MGSQTIEAPGRNGMSSVQFSAVSPIAVSVWRGTDDDGVPQFDLIDVPLGTHLLITQPRMCGDWYAELTAGKLIRCSTGSTQADAIRNVSATMSEVL